MLLAAKARQLGYDVSDLEIGRYLYALVDNKLTEDQLKAALIGPDRRFSLRGVYEVLREEMLARKLFEDFYRGWQTPPPGQQLEYYARINRRIRLELLSLPVDAFLKEVPQPSEAELNAFFDKYKANLPPVDFVGGQTLTSPTPGFKLPHRVSVESVRGHVEELMDVVRDEISDEEIAAYYEANKVTDERLHAEDELPLPELEPADRSDQNAAQPPGANSTEQRAGEEAEGAADQTAEALAPAADQPSDGAEEETLAEEETV
ncbi:MAG: hypothetical protein GTO03_09365, partial [Planctomycetales bacterium]|nr:hypothetical protein [Planctomycetales bacterium]